MNGSFCAAGAVALITVLLSCAGFPEPDSPGNSLVIGSAILEFPDGFFNEPPQDFYSNVKVSFVNMTIGDHRYSFSGIRVNMPVTATADSVIYLGHMVFT